MFACSVVRCLPIFPLQGVFCLSLFYFVIKRNKSPAFESSPHFSSQTLTHTKQFFLSFITQIILIVFLVVKKINYMMSKILSIIIV